MLRRLGIEFQSNTGLLDNPPQPAAAVASSGLFLLVWNDATSIAGRLYDVLGNPFGSPFFVNEDLADNAQLPEVGVDSSGNFVVVWEISNQDGEYQGVFARRLDSLGTPIGTEFQVNTITEGSQMSPAIDVVPSGDFVVVWVSYTPPNEVRGQRFDSAGGKIGTEFQVTPSVGSFVGHYYLDVDHASTGDFVVVWHDFDGNNDGVFGQRFDSNGTKVGSAFQSNTITGGFQGVPQIGFDGTNNFVVVWYDGNLETIFARRYESAGTAVGDQFQVSTHTVESASAGDPTINVATGGEFVVAWQEIPADGDGYGILARRFDSQGTAQGTEFLVNSSTVFFQTDPDIAALSNGNFVVVWDSYHPVKAQRFLITCGNGAIETWETCDPPDGVTCTTACQSFDIVLGGEMQANTFTVGNQSDNDVAVSGDGTFLVVWTDVNTASVRGQFYDASASPLGSELQISSSPVGSQSHARASGGFVTVWSELGRDGAGSGVFGRMSADGGPIGSDFQVNTTTTDDSNYPSVAVADGPFFVSWTALPSKAVYAQRFSALGAKLGTEFQVSPSSLQGSLYYGSQIAAELSGEFVVVWHDSDGGGKGVFAKRFDSDGNSIGAAFQVNTYTPGNQFDPDVGLDSDGDFVISWAGGGPGGYDGIFARRFAGDTTPQGDQFTVSQDSFPVNSNVQVADGGEFVVVWAASLFDPNLGIKARRFESDGTPIGEAFQVNSYTINFQAGPSVAGLGSGGFVVSWDSYGQDGNYTGVFFQRFIPSCGNFVVEGWEVCEPPNSFMCTASCQGAP